MKVLRYLTGPLLLAGLLSGAAWSLPDGANVTRGNVQVRNSGGTQTVTQSGQRAIINWNGFNIEVGELVHFVQPNSAAAILNRVVGQNPSMILGALRSNGQVFLINPNGIVFGDSAQINVGSLVASTLNISDDNFLRGNLTFEQVPDKALAAVINKGNITLDPNGFLVLTGPMVANEGVILARTGQVALAGGTRSTVSFDPTGKIQVALPAGSASSDGIVSLTRDATNDLLASVVTSSAKPAGKLVTRNGRTFLEVESGTVVNSGQIRAEGANGKAGGNVVLDSTTHTLLGPSSLTSAAGFGVNSPGGEVLLLSDGQLSAVRGSRVDASGSGTGDGGFVEYSSNYGLIDGHIDTSSLGGKMGMTLIDPRRILVTTGDGTGLPPAPPDVIYVSENSIEESNTGMALLAEAGIDFQPLDGGALTMGPDLPLLLAIMGPSDGGDAITFANPGDRIVLSGLFANFDLEVNSNANVRDLQVVNGVFGNITISLNGGSLVGDTVLQGGILGSQITAANIGTATSPVKASGRVTFTATGDVFLESLDMTEVRGTAANFTGRGQSYILAGVVEAQNVIFDITGDLSATDVSNPLARGNTVNVSAGTIGAGQDPIFEANNLTLSSTDGDISALVSNDTYTLQTLNLSNPSGPTSVREQSGEELVSFDPVGRTLQVTTPAGVSYTTQGDVVLQTVEQTSSLAVSTTGAVSGTLVNPLQSLTLTGSSINASSTSATGAFRPTATAGDILWSGQLESLNSESAGNTQITTSSATLTATGRADGAITISNSAGDILSGPGQIIASGITLSGNNVLVNTQGQVIVVNAQGQVTMSNSAVDVSSLTIDTTGEVRFTTQGNLAIAQVAGGPLVRLVAGGNISALTDAVVRSQGSVGLQAGGTITPNLDAPLRVEAVTSLAVSVGGGAPLAQALPISGALSGNLPASSVTVTGGSGPVYYNGQLLNPPPVPPPPVPPPPVPPTPPTPVVPPAVIEVVNQVVPEVVNQFGQQAGQLIDDGSVGSAANDGVVEESPTQQLVAKLLEAAEGAEGQGLSTALLVTFEIDALGELKVTLAEGQPSPVDARIEGAADLRADDLIDLEAEELGDVGASLYYDPATDQIIMAINLRADDIIDLDISEFQELPVKLNYVFLSDPKIIADALRADDIIDLEVEDLGQIPVRLYIEGGESSDAAPTP